MKIKVQKRDGAFEDYDSSKITRVVMAAGLTDTEAKRLASNIDAWLQEQAITETTSIKIRDRIITEIQKINENIGNKFIWYEKQRDKNFGLDET